MNEYHKLEEPDVYKARRLAIEIADATVKNQMILREHSRYKLLREEVERQNIKEKALLQLSEQRNIQPSEKAVFERVLVNANRQPELNGVSRAPLPTPPTPMSDQGDEDEEKVGADEEGDDIPEMIKLYNDMDEEQLNIVLEAFKTDIDNLGPDSRARLRAKGEQQIELYGDVMNAGVYDLIAELLEYIDDVDEEEEEEEEVEVEVEEEAAARKEEEEDERIPTTGKQLKDYIKDVGYRTYVDQLLIKDLEKIYQMIKQGQSGEAIKAKIEAYYKQKQAAKKQAPKKQAPKKKRGRPKKQAVVGNGITGNGLTQLGTGIAENLQKLMVMVGSKQAGNDSAALLKKIVALQKKIKKDIEKKRKSESEAVRKEVTRQKIKKLAKDQMK